MNPLAVKQFEHSHMSSIAAKFTTRVRTFCDKNEKRQWEGFIAFTIIRFAVIPIAIKLSNAFQS